jgi:hypothetical protein
LWTKSKSKSCQISRKCFLKLTYLDNRFHINICIYISSIFQFWKFSESFQNLEIFFNLENNFISFHFIFCHHSANVLAKTKNCWFQEVTKI